MKRGLWFTCALVGGTVLFAGCGGSAVEKTAKAEHGAHAEGEAGAGVAFKDGRGLTLNPEIVGALGVKTVDVEEKPLSGEMKLLGQVFTTEPQVLASATVPEAEGERLAKKAFTGAKLVRIERASAAGTKRVDAIFALDRHPAPQVGEFVELQLSSEPQVALTVPRSAILDAATGTYVYVVNGEYYLRTAVKIGARAGDFVAIADGLHVSDVVVASPVDQLWLIELRLTKGGGHSH